jgi:hypothetical protein
MLQIPIAGYLALKDDQYIYKKQIYFMKLTSAVLLICSFCLTTTAIAQQQYQGTLHTKLGQVMKGEITINLKGENAEMIEVKTTEKIKGKRSKQTTTTTTRLNSAIIKHIEINKTIYYLRDIKIGYDDKLLRNVCVQLIHGTIDCGLFQSREGTEANSVAVKFPKAGLSELASVDFDYYNTSISVRMRISDCKTLLAKMGENDETVSWTETNSREQRIQRFKNIITEYNACAIKN